MEHKTGWFKREDAGWEGVAEKFWFCRYGLSRIYTVPPEAQRLRFVLTSEAVPGSVPVSKSARYGFFYAAGERFLSEGFWGVLAAHPEAKYARLEWSEGPVEKKTEWMYKVLYGWDWVGPEFSVCAIGVRKRFGVPIDAKKIRFIFSVQYYHRYPYDGVTRMLPIRFDNNAGLLLDNVKVGIYGDALAYVLRNPDYGYVRVEYER